MDLIFLSDEMYVMTLPLLDGGSEAGTTTTEADTTTSEADTTTSEADDNATSAESGASKHTISMAAGSLLAIAALALAMQ